MSEKQHKPTPRRLQDARREGEVVRSADVGGTLVFIGVLALLWQGGPYLIERLRGLLLGAVGAAARARDPGAVLQQVLAYSTLRTLEKRLLRRLVSNSRSTASIRARACPDPKVIRIIQISTKKATIRWIQNG